MPLVFRLHWTHPRASFFPEALNASVPPADSIWCDERSVALILQLYQLGEHSFLLPLCAGLQSDLILWPWKL